MKNLQDEPFELAVLLGKPVLFSEDPIDRDTLPEGLYAYDIRQDDKYLPAALEDRVDSGRFGTVISNVPLDICEDHLVFLGEDDFRIDEYATATPDQYTRGEYELTPEPEKEIRVLVVDPFKEPYERTVPNTLKAHQSLVGGYIEVISPFSDTGIVLICNEEGKLNGLPYNRSIGDRDIIAGTFFLCGVNDRNGSFASLTPEQAKRYKQVFKTPEFHVHIKPARSKLKNERTR